MEAVLEAVADEVTGGLISGPVAVTTKGRKVRSLFERGQLTVRIARLDEANAIASLAQAIFDGRDYFSQSKFKSADDIEDLMAQGKFLLAEKEDRIVGFAYLEPRLEATRLDLIAVSPAQQRTGIGSQLLYAAERLSSSMHCLFIHVQVMNLHRETIKFCRRRGFVEFGIEALDRHQAISPHCHIVKMCKQLDMERLGF